MDTNRSTGHGMVSGHRTRHETGTAVGARRTEHLPGPRGAATRWIPTAMLTLLFLLVSGCGGSATSPADPPPSTTAPPARTAADPDPAEVPSLVARARGPVAVFVEPNAAEPMDVLEATTVYGSPRVLLVKQTVGDWHQVLLPGRPNGSTAWIQASEVTLNRVVHLIEVSLGDLTLTLYEDGREILTTPVAVGTEANPTPVGLYYITDKVQSAAGDDSAYGPFALGLSAHSETLTEFAGGEGQIALQGTIDESSIGTRASHGSIRVPNEVIVRLAEILPLGVPVVVVP